MAASPIDAWSPQNTAHAGRNGYSADLAASVAFYNYPGKATRISHKG